MGAGWFLGFEKPLLVITARGQIEDKVEVLQAGADDYITKPFSFKELLARSQAGECQLFRFIRRVRNYLHI